jgi:agmatinase
MTAISNEWKEINTKLCIEAIEYIGFLEDGGKLEDNTDFQTTVATISEAQNALKENLKNRALDLMKQGKLVGVLGGEHSTPLGLIEAIDAQNKPFGILQIDAHADLRDAYEGFEQSHASIMFNALKNCPNLIKLVQVGIRDIAQSEVDLIENSNGRISTYFDWTLKEGQFNGETWASQIDAIINDLPENVYISFDIDGLSPELCPNTGTPVAGGFKLEEVTYLFFKLAASGKKLVGFDLNEVAPGKDDDWDANVGARALWNLVCAVESNRRSHN